MSDPQPILDRLARSTFRSRFRLRESDQKYMRDKGLAVVMSHAERFIRTRLAPAHPTNDGSQTPTKGHPAFIAQHATATCCRTCLQKWHGMAKDVELSDAQVAQILQVIEAWFGRQGIAASNAPTEPGLFDLDPPDGQG